MWNWVGDGCWLGWDGAGDDVVEGDDVVAEAFGEFEGALEIGGGCAWRPGDVEVVKHGLADKAVVRSGAGVYDDWVLMIEKQRL